MENKQQELANRLQELAREIPAARGDKDEGSSSRARPDRQLGRGGAGGQKLQGLEIMSPSILNLISLVSTELWIH